jgi:hypothetical protein
LRHWILRVALCCLIACSSPDHSSPDYIYLYECSGTISKFDAVTKRGLGRWPAEEIPGLADLVPLPVSDGCALYDLHYVAGALFGVVAKNANESAEPTQPYALLAVQLPEVRVTAHVNLPASANIPRLAVTAQGQLMVQYELPGSKGVNQTWVARYDATLNSIGEPLQSAQFVDSSPPRGLPEGIPVIDKFVRHVFADR